MIRYVILQFWIYLCNFNEADGIDYKNSQTMPDKREIHLELPPLPLFFVDLRGLTGQEFVNYAHLKYEDINGHLDQVDSD